MIRTTNSTKAVATTVGHDTSLGLWLKIESKGTLKGARNACEDAYIMDKVECVDSLVYRRMRKKEELQR